MKIFRLFLAVIFIVLSAAFTLNSEVRLQNWIAHTSLVQTQSLDIDKAGRIWAATSGGLYSVNPDGSDIKIFRNIDQMLDINISAVKVHPLTGYIYTGSVKGYIDIYDNNGKWIHVTDIFNQKFTDPRINDIAFYGDKAYIAGNFGLAVLDTKKMVFDETVRRFADFNTNLPAYRILIDKDKIWISTNGGIASASLNNLLSNPANWTPYHSNPGFFETAIFDMTIHEDTIYAMSQKFITYLNNDSLKEFKNLGTGNLFTAINSSVVNGLVYTDLFGLHNKNGDVIKIKNSDTVLLTGFIPYRNNEKTGYVIKYENNGLEFQVENKYIDFIPNSPLSSISGDLAVDKDGNLWVGSDEGGSARGIAMYDGELWRNFTNKTNPEIVQNSYFRITASKSGKIAAGSYGAGFLIIEPKGNKNYNFHHFDTSNSELIGLANAPNFLVCGKPRFDNEDNVWVPMLGTESVGPAIVQFDKDYKSYGYKNTKNPFQRYFWSLAIDFNGTKWVGGSRSDGLGILYYNENKTPENTADDKSGFLTQNDYPNIPDNTHLMIEVDKSGYVWIGTPRGLAVIANPSSALASKPNINVRNLNKIINEQSINYILVDAQNNKWIGTNNGIWVINSDGSDTVGTVNVSNSPLPSNEITSIGYNENTGQMYFGTTQGIYEATGLSVLPANKYNIVCYPQPFNTKKDNEMIIEGLEEFSDIRIVTASGAFVTQFFTNSNKAAWDGKDKNGNEVPSGVYLVLATSSSSKNSAIQKIAVIKD